MEKQIKINDIIFEKIKFRYNFFSDDRLTDRMRHNKLFLDSFYPYLIANKIIKPNNVITLQNSNNNGFAISERVAADMNARQLHISELTTMLGYTKTDISKLLQGVKNKEFNLTLVGLGGTGSNFLYWAYEMAEWTGKTEIFKDMYMFDEDEFDIPNMLRIPFIPQFNNNEGATKINCVPKKYDMLAQKVRRYSDFLVEDMMEDNIFNYREKMVIYGAPDIHTREFLSASPITFIAGTHRDSTVSMVENPAVDNDLMMETYGKINLSKFFLNHLTLTIQFLKHLKNRINFGTTEEQTLMISNFNDMYQEQVNNGFKAGSKKLFIPDEYWVNEENLELPGEEHE